MVSHCGFDMIFLMISYLNIFSCMCLFSINIYYLDKCIFKPFAHFWIQFFFFFFADDFRSSLYTLVINLFSGIWKYVFSFFGLLFYSDNTLWMQKIKKFHEVQFVCFFLCCLCLWYHIQIFFLKFSVLKHLT